MVVINEGMGLIHTTLTDRVDFMLRALSRVLIGGIHVNALFNYMARSEFT